MLAAYNGAEYLCEQIDSILAQEGVQVHLLIRDDGSTDGTPALIQASYGDDDRVEVVAGRENLGCAQSFMTMAFEASPDHDYYAFSDQDDYWKPDRLKRALEQMGADSVERSVLYCCNREEVDAGRKFLYHNVPLECAERCKTLEYLLFVRNAAPGNTMVFSRAFLDRLREANPISFPSGFYHDFWVHLVGATLAETTVIYDYDYSGVERRITGTNLAGINRQNRRSIKSLLNQLKKYDSGSLRVTVRQLMEKYDGSIDDERRELLELFVGARHPSARWRLLKASSNVKFDSVKGRLFSLYKLLTGKI